MSTQEVLMNLIANLAVVGGAILGLMLAKDTITGVLGQKASGLFKSAQNGLQKFGVEKAGDKWKQSAYMRGRAIRKQARDNLRTEKFAQRVQKGGLSRIAATGVRGLLPGKSGEKQRAALQRSSYAAAVKADEEDVNHGAQLATSNAIRESAQNGTEVHKILQKQHMEAIELGDSVAARAYQQALEGQGEPGMSAITKNLQMASTRNVFTRDAKGKEMKEDLMKHISGNAQLYKGGDQRTYAFGTTGDEGKLHSNADFSGLTDQQIVSQTRESIASAIAGGSLDDKMADRILNNDKLDIKQGKRSVIGGAATSPAGTPGYTRVSPSLSVQNSNDRTPSQ